MNILYTNFHTGIGGGHTTYIRSLVHNKKHRCFAACAPQSRLYRLLDEERFDGLFPLYFPSRIWELPKIVAGARRLRRIINDNAIDIVHTNGSVDNRLALYASWLPGRPFKVVLTKHNTKKRGGLVSRWRFDHFNDAVIFVSESAVTMSGVKPGNPRHHVVENGIDLDWWRKGKAIATGDTITLVSNAGTSPHKQWDVMARAVASLPADAGRRLNMIVLGRIPRDADRDFPLIDFPGYLDDARPILDDADVGFVLSRFESCSFASREMSAMSLPVVSSDFPNAFQNIDESCGWITPSGDVDAVRNVLLDILAMSPEALNVMKHAARGKAEADFSLERMIDRTNAVYDSLAEKNGADAR